MKQIIEYVWLHNSFIFKSITQLSNKEIDTLNELPICNIEFNNKIIELIPYRIFKCPFRKENNIFVLCNINNNERNNLLNNNYSNDTLIEFTQQLYLIDVITNRPLGFPPNEHGDPPKKDYYCGIGVLSSFGRKYMDEFMNNCIFSNIEIEKINSLVTPGHWQYRIKKLKCIDSLDNLIASKYILEKVCEKYNLIPNYNNLNKSDWNKSKLIFKFTRDNMLSNEINVRKYINALKNDYENKISKFYKSDLNNYKFTVGANKTDTLLTVNDTCTDYIIDNRAESNINPYDIIKNLLEILTTSDFCNNSICSEDDEDNFFF